MTSVPAMRPQELSTRGAAPTPVSVVSRDKHSAGSSTVCSMLNDGLVVAASAGYLVY